MSFLRRDRPQLDPLEERRAAIERSRQAAEDSVFLATQIKELSLSDDADEAVVARVAAALSDRVVSAERPTVMHLYVAGQPTFVLNYRASESRIEIDGEPVGPVEWLAGLRQALRAERPEPEAGLEL